MSAVRIFALIGLAVLIALPSVTPTYFLHLLIQILIWAFIYTAWSLMGRFGFVSFGHGAFMGVGAYVPALLWNYYGAHAMARHSARRRCCRRCSRSSSAIRASACKVVGHYFALVTLALSQVVLLSLTAARDITGGSLGFTPKAVGHSWYALQFPDKSYFYGIALVLWLVGLCGLAADRPRHRPRGARGDLRGRGRRRRGRHQRAAREDARDRHQRGADRARRRDLRPVLHVSQSRHGVGHRGVAADRVRGHRRRHLFAAGADGRRAADACR